MWVIFSHYFLILMDRAYGWGVLPSIDGYFNRRRFMILVSAIGFSYTHHLVALSRNHFRHFRFQKPKWRPSDKKIGNSGGGVGSRIGYHMGHIAVTGEHIQYDLYLLVIIPLPGLSWPSGGHFVCITVTAILVYRSKSMFASHRGVYMNIIHGCYQNHESASLLLTIILIFGFHLGFYP